MEKQRPKIGVGVNVSVIRDGKILLGLRKNTVGDGTWGLPGGHLEMMESLEDGAKRELLEETGLVAKNLIFANIVNDPLPESGTHYIHINFLAGEIIGNPEIREPEKCAEWRWFDLNEIPNLFIGHKKIIPAYLEGKNFVD